MIGFILGFVVGAMCGVATTALCVAASRNDITITDGKNDITKEDTE